MSFYIFIGCKTLSNPVIFFGSWILKKTDLFLHRIPFIKVFYKTIKQILETILKSNSDAFREAVLVEYPRKGSWAIGFATKDNKGEISKKTNQSLVNVFVPTTPNPTSGFLLMFPKNEIKYLDMSFEEASKFIVSAGTSNPKN